MRRGLRLLRDPNPPPPPPGPPLRRAPTRRQSRMSIAFSFCYPPEIRAASLRAMLVILLRVNSPLPDWFIFLAGFLRRNQPALLPVPKLRAVMNEDQLELWRKIDNYQLEPP